MPTQAINILEARAELTAAAAIAETENGPVLLRAKAGAMAQSNLGGSTLALGLPGGGTLTSVAAGTAAIGAYGDLGLSVPLGRSAELSATLGGELRSDGFQAVSGRAGLGGSF